VLARPNGLAGWTLPAAPVGAGDSDDPAWRAALEQAATRAVGAPVVLVRPVGADAWEVEPRGRIPRAGAAWISPSEAGRLGADAGVLAAWDALDPPDG